MLRASARACTSCRSAISAALISFIPAAAGQPSTRSAPTLKIWMTPFASVAMLEKLALLKIALWSAPMFSRASARPASLRLLFVPTFRRATVGVWRRSTGGVFGCVIACSGASCRCGSRTAAGGNRDVIGIVRPDAEGLERVLRDEATVLADDHYGGDRRSLGRVPVHGCLHLDPRELADRPLAVLATRTAAGAAGLERSDDAMLVVGGDSFVIIHGVPHWC